MFSHVTLGTNDPARALAFYDAVMPTLSHALLFRLGEGAAYGTLTGPKLFIGRPFDDGKLRRAATAPTSHLSSRRARRSIPSTPPHWHTAAATKARRACARTIIRTTTGPMCEIPTATSYRRCVTASPVRRRSARTPQDEDRINHAQRCGEGEPLDRIAQMIVGQVVGDRRPRRQQRRDRRLGYQHEHRAVRCLAVGAFDDGAVELGIDDQRRRGFGALRPARDDDEIGANKLPLGRG